MGRGGGGKADGGKHHDHVIVWCPPTDMWWLIPLEPLNELLVFKQFVLFKLRFWSGWVMLLRTTPFSHAFKIFMIERNNMKRGCVFRCALSVSACGERCQWTGLLGPERCDNSRVVGYIEGVPKDIKRKRRRGERERERNINCHGDLIIKYWVEKSK